MRTLSFLLIIAFSIPFAFAEKTYGQVLKENSISYSVRSKQIADVFNDLSKQTGFHFFYEESIIEDLNTITIDIKNGSIDYILNQLTEQTGLQFKKIDKTISVSRNKATPLITGNIQQQDKRQIKGVITDEKGEPIIGANVVEKGTTNGTITDLDGNFSLDISSSASILISYIGYQEREMQTANQTLFNIKLAEDLQALDEVVVIGYGTTTKKNFTGSVTSFKLESSPISLSSNVNALETLKGNVAGLDIGGTNSAGGQPTMLVRGQHSISGTNDPLIVVDGIIFMGTINDLNPNDIASFDILKDATSAAAYGSRSANGVIVITTKKGKTGKPIINLNVTGSMQKWHLQPELMSGEQWLNMVRDKNKYEDYSFLTSQQKINYDKGKEVDWIDATTHTGWLQDYQVSVSGAGEKMNYYLSTSYTDNQGIVVGDEYSRMTILGKIETDITDWLKIGIDAAYTHSDYSGIGANLNNVTVLTPYDMMYRDEANTLLEKYPNGQSEAMNALWGVDSNNLDDKDIRNNFRTNAYMVIKLPQIKGLSYRLNYSGNLDDRENGRFYHESYYAPIGPYDDDSRYSVTTQQNYLASSNGYIENIKTTSWVIDNILNYKNMYGKHSVDLTAVATRDSKAYKYEQMTGTDFFSNGNTSLGINGLHYAKTQKFNLDNNKRRNIGYFGRISYSFDDTYYLTMSYRRDGASVFGTKNKWGNFGAVGTAWRITNESFMKRFTFLNDLKIKLSWGKNGNQGIDPYGTLSKVKSGSSGGIFYPFDNSGQPSYGIKQDNIGNAKLGWETTEAWNMGFESTWLNSRLFVDVDYYYSRTYDQIFTRTIPVMTGFTNMKSSMGEVHNKGVEITLRSLNVQTKDLTWSTSLTFWLNRNKLKHLYGEDLNGDGKEDDDIGNELFIGHSINSIYGYKQDGIVQAGDLDYINANGVTPGTPKYVDLNEDGFITIEDRTIIGNKDARFKLNMNNTISWKNWELYVMLTGTFGGKGYFQESNKPAYMAGGRGDFFLSNNIYIPYWTESNASNKYPAAWFLGDDYFLGLQSRAYIRLQDLTFSYSFKQQSIKDVGINNLKLFFTAKNLATITGWKGGDPELGNNITSGIWPVATSFSIGANISF